MWYSKRWPRGPSGQAGGPEQVVGDCGVVVESNDPELLASSIGELLADPERRARLGEASVERARQFSWRVLPSGPSKFTTKPYPPMRRVLLVAPN